MKRHFGRLSDTLEVEESANNETHQYEVCLIRETAEGDAMLYLDEQEARRLGQWLLEWGWLEPASTMRDTTTGGTTR